MKDNQKRKEAFQLFLSQETGPGAGKATPAQVHKALGSMVLDEIGANWAATKAKTKAGRQAAYFSAEFLLGRLVYNNLLCLGLTQAAEDLLAETGYALADLEEIEDAALGNGGLGRLAACFLDSAATLDLPLTGYGIRYRYGLFRQRFVDGFQEEEVDDWTRQGDPWSKRMEGESVTVDFADGPVTAVPYDIPIVGYGTKTVGTLRLWQAEPITPFDFGEFNEQHYDKAMKHKNLTENISRVLYPNDTRKAGQRLRLRQQYFFSAASLKDLIRSYQAQHGDDFCDFAQWNTIQLNDTHPVIAMPELMRLLADDHGVPLEEAFQIAHQTFAYTNHTVMAEALEKWNEGLFAVEFPRLLDIVRWIDHRLHTTLEAAKMPMIDQGGLLILDGGQVRMANLAVYVAHTVNGVAKIHSNLLKETVFSGWFSLYPGRFQNKTNGITQRRWMGLANPALSALFTRLLGGDSWMTDLSALKSLEKYADDRAVLAEFMAIKRQNRQDLAEYVQWRDHLTIDPNTIIDVQIKRLHEYKRQLLNILGIFALYLEIKSGALVDFAPTTFLFGAKAAPGYRRAKGIIKLIHEVGRIIAADPVVSPRIQVVFVENYDVSYAEKIVAGADVSEQISTAGTEASGTGNMKLMLNGAVTLGTFDGATVEIVEEAGLENNYIFGATIDQIGQVAKTYDPRQIYEENPLIKQVMDALCDGTLDDGETGYFQELFESILLDGQWHRADQYYLLLDFMPYLERRKALNRDYGDRFAFARKAWLNACKSGKFSADNTIGAYAKDIWQIQPFSWN